MSLWETRKRKENLATSQCLLTQKTEWCTICLPMEGLHPSLDSLSNRRFCFSVRMGVKHCSEINPMVYLRGWVLKAEQPSSFLASISSAVSPSPPGLLIATAGASHPPLSLQLPWGLPQWLDQRPSPEGRDAFCQGGLHPQLDCTHESKARK